jgi:hypothetical protein
MAASLAPPSSSPTTFGMASRWRSWSSITTSSRSRALLGHSRMDTTQVYASIRPPQLKRAVSFYEEKAVRMLSQ